MAERVCPPWVGYLLASPIRLLLHNPRKILSPYVGDGMTVLEPCPGMGFFSSAGHATKDADQFSDRRASFVRQSRQFQLLLVIQIKVHSSLRHRPQYTPYDIYWERLGIPDDADRGSELKPIIVPE